MNARTELPDLADLTLSGVTLTACTAAQMSSIPTSFHLRFLDAKLRKSGIPPNPPLSSRRWVLRDSRAPLPRGSRSSSPTLILRGASYLRCVTSLFRTTRSPASSPSHPQMPNPAPSEARFSRQSPDWSNFLAPAPARRSPTTTSSTSTSCCACPSARRSGR